MRPLRALISGAGGDVAQGVLKALRAATLPVETFLTCIDAASPGLHLGSTGFVAPRSDDPAYLPFLIRLLRQLRADAFIPCVDSEIGLIAAARVDIEVQTGARVLVDTPERIAICDDKLATAQFLAACGLPFPKSIAANATDASAQIESMGLPLVIKPRRGRGSAGVRVVQHLSAVREVLGSQDLMVQEWLDPAQGEYTAGVYLGLDSEIKGTCLMRRELRGGSTIRATRELDPALVQSVERVALALGMRYVNIQAMRRGDTLIPFEFNGRFSGTTGIISRVFNAPEWYLREAVLGERIERSANAEAFVAMRYYTEAYATEAELESVRLRSTL